MSDVLWSLVYFKEHVAPKLDSPKETDLLQKPLLDLRNIVILLTLLEVWLPAVMRMQILLRSWRQLAARI